MNHKILNDYLKNKYCDTFNRAGRARFFTLLDNKVLYSIKWHAAHTSPNCIPTWSAQAKQACSFCTFTEKENPHLSEYEYESHSALSYSRDVLQDESLVAFLNTLGAKKEPRDLAREAKKAEEQKQAEQERLAKQQKRERHSRFLKTLKVGDCVEGYLYYDCKKIYYSGYNSYRIKVNGRLVAVADKEGDYCFLKIERVKTTAIYNESYHEWQEGATTFCGSTRSYIGQEKKIKKRDILHKCY